jgi:hypothetical protein
MHALLDALEILLAVDYDAIVGSDATGTVHQCEILHGNIPQDISSLFNNISGLEPR